MKIVSKELIKTSDLALVTALSLYSPIESTEFTDKKKIVFAFIRTPELENLIDLYWRGEMRVDPKQFFTQLKDIKTRIYSQI